jgi:hypothetical protein
MTNKMPVVGKRYKLKSGKNITVVQEEIGGTIEYGVEVFNTIFEELPEDNLQETEECCPIETAEAAWNMSEVNETPNPVDFKKEEVNEVDRALEAEKSLCLKNDQKLDTKEFDSLGLDTKQDMSKPEPKIDIKEEHVEPVSIWKDVSMQKIEIGSEWQSIDGKVVTIDFVKNDLVVWTYEFNDREQITLSTHKEIFIKDFKELKRNLFPRPPQPNTSYRQCNSSNPIA